MIVTYAPEDPADGDTQTWQWTPRRVRSSEAERIEKRYGDTWSAFVRDAVQGNMAARRLLLWSLMLRDHPKLRFEDAPDFYAGEVRIDSTRVELVDQRARIEVDPDLDEETRSRVLEVIDRQIERAEDPGEGKAPANSDALTG